MSAPGTNRPDARMDLELLAQLASEATPGPWTADGHYVEAADTGIAGNFDYEDGGIIKPVDALFIAACDPQTVVALVEAVRTARRYLEVADDDPALTEMFADWLEAMAPFASASSADASPPAGEAEA